MNRLPPILGCLALAALATSGTLPRQAAEGSRQSAVGSTQYAGGSRQSAVASRQQGVGGRGGSIGNLSGFLATAPEGRRSVATGEAATVQRVAAQPVVDFAHEWTSPRRGEGVPAGLQCGETNIALSIQRRASDRSPLSSGSAGERARVRGLLLNRVAGVGAHRNPGGRGPGLPFGPAPATRRIPAAHAYVDPERMTFAQWNDRWERERTAFDRNGVPDWQVDSDFEDDVFTFVRIQYDSSSGWQRWATDYPDADLNFSYRLKELTSLEVDPQGKVLQLTDPELFDHPFIYLVEPGAMRLTAEEGAALRRYLRNGGFLMIDDFWGEDEWDNLHAELKRVFPDLEPVELPLDHPIFHCVYDLTEKPQVPSVGVAQSGRFEGVTWEREDAKEPHYRGLFDEQGRLMAIICHNTDLGDGWEREGEDEWYFREFSEKKAYPLGINIVFYAMTH